MTPVFILITAATFAYFVSVGALIPTLPLYVEGPLGGGSVSVGLSIGAFSFSAVLLRPWVGHLGDRRGRRLLMVLGGLLVGASVAAYIAVESFTSLLVLRFITGAGEAFFYVGAASAINDLAPDERRGEALSFFSLALYSGIAIGPVLGETVLKAYDFDAAWLVAAVSGFIAAVLAVRVPDTRPEPLGETGMRRFVHPAALMPGTVLAASIWGLAGFNGFITLYALDIGMDGSRALFVTFSVVVLAIRGLGARIPDRLGPARTSRAALAFSATGLAVMGAWPESVGLFSGTVVFGVGQALAFPALMTMAVKSAPASERGSVVGTFTAFFDLAFGLGAVSLGGVAAVFGYRGLFLTASGIAGVGLGALIVRATRRRQAAAAPPIG
ncbi:MAG: MFS transporter [Actinomycetota bacterium]